MKSQKMPAEKDPVSSVYHREGPAPMKEVIPLSIQHVIAMIIGCMTPAVIVANYAGLDASEKVILIQGAFIIAALSTFFQSYKVGKYFGSGIPTVMGLSFAFLPSLQAMAQGYGIACILGAQIIGGLIAILIGWNVRYLMKLFPPLVTGTVVFVVGLSLYPTAVTYMAGGDGNPDFGSWQNWLVAIVTLLVVFILNNFAKGVLKLSSILGGIVVGYILVAAFGMVDFSCIGEAAVFQAPKLLHFGLEFDPAALAQFPERVSMIFGKSPVVLATIIVVIVNQVLPKEKEQEEESDVSRTAAVKTRKQTEQKTVTGSEKETCRV